MASGSPRRVQRVQPKTYSTCMLYSTHEAKEKLKGAILASCNPNVEVVSNSLFKDAAANQDRNEESMTLNSSSSDLQKLSISDKMSCNFCDAIFQHRLDQKRHYRSDWHRYNLKQRLHGKPKVTEEEFEEISGNISSLSGSDSEGESDSDAGGEKKENKSKLLVPGASAQFRRPVYSSTDSESESGNQALEKARRLPKLYLRNGAGELISVYRCVVCHKKEQPARMDDLLTMVTDVLDQMNWAVFMVGGGHFAAAIYNKGELVAHKTFHRYVVRAKRGTAQGSRDSQGNAPKSAGASLRRYNEAALTQDIHDLISSWGQHIKACDRIFLRAPSFNRKIFFSGKTPPLNKDDARIRLIPFQTRRPTFNEVRRVYEMLASIECYGEESELQDLIPISPPQVYNQELGQLTVRDESQMTPKQRKMLNKKLRSSPLVAEDKQASNDTDQTNDELVKEKLDTEVAKAVPDYVLDQDNMSSGTSTASDTELMETMATIDLMEHKQFYGTKKPKRRKKSAKHKRQTEPESNVMEEEKYHLKNSLYTACKVGDSASLKNLLAIFLGGRPNTTEASNESNDNNKATSHNNTVEVTDKSGDSNAFHAIRIDNKNGDNETSDKHDYGCNNNMTKDGIVNETNIDSRSKDKDTLTCSSANRDSLKASSVGSKTDRENCDRKDGDTSVIDDDEIEKNKPNTTAETQLSSSEFLSESTLEFAPLSKDKGANSNVESDKAANSNVESDKGAKCNVEWDKNSDIAISISESIVEADDNQNQNEGSVDNAKKLQLPLLRDLVGGQAVVTDMSPVVTMSMLNESFGDNNTTLLHVAAREGHKSIVVMLMEAGASPCAKEKSGHTPYMVSKDKPTRNEFRKFMGKWPDKYDYSQAQIPSPLTDDMEAEKRKKDAEKKKAQKKIRQEKQKIKREEEEKQQAEDREKKRFLNLSDREKRAIAAERRLVSQASDTGGPKPVLVRCFQCGADMTGKIPFEYNSNKFCTSKCLQLHRKAQTKS